MGMTNPQIDARTPNPLTHPSNMITWKYFAVQSVQIRTPDDTHTYILLYYYHTKYHTEYAKYWNFGAIQIIWIYLFWSCTAPGINVQTTHYDLDPSFVGTGHIIAALIITESLRLDRPRSGQVRAPGPLENMGYLGPMSSTS